MAKKEKMRDLGVSEKEGHPMGHGEFANMPQEKMMKPYPRSRNYRGGVEDDTITGIDQISTVSEGKAQRFLSNQK
jgi:hypothetical protein